MGDIIRKRKGGRDLGWYIRWKEHGKRRQLASHQPTYALAKRMLLEIEARVARGLAGIIEPDARAQLTVAQLCERFLAEYASPRLKDVAAYRRGAASRLRRVLPYIGDVTLGDLGRQHVVRARDALAQQYPAGTTRTTLIPLMAAFSWAVRQGLLQSNPAHGVDRPPSPQTQIDFLSQDEVRRLLSAAEARARGEKGVAQRMWRSRHVALLLAVLPVSGIGEILLVDWLLILAAPTLFTVIHEDLRGIDRGATTASEQDDREHSKK